MTNKQTPPTIYLKDYTVPSYIVETVDLDIRIFEQKTLVTTVLKMHKNADANFAGSDDIVLFGRDLELLDISVNGKALPANDYELDSEQLVIKNAPNEAELVINVCIHPEKNTSCEGLYLVGNYNKEDKCADTMFVTQCEAEGFRKITFFPDRPDVLAEFTTRVEAPKNLPVILANGNLVKKGELEDNRHFSIWHDPTKKPSYLFACVACDLEVLQDTFTTSEGREVALELYATEEDIKKCHVSMQALKDSMKWDEDEYGCVYDLDVYMIVATSMFNMGAMENKGLNIFNTSCVLSHPEYTTDARNLTVKAVVAHEYFHNWTGNRITCRDWFQLCLKEGLTVFRDQSFTTTIQSEAVQRVNDVSVLKASQFTEDAGPLAHPPRPHSFVEINNFYTATVYEKGAEIARMIANLLGKEAYRRATDSYLKRFDGMAVTVEDMLDAFSDNGKDGEQGIDVRHFMDWYTQPGTPSVFVETHYDDVAKTFTLNMRQETRHVPGFDAPKALPIPVATALFSDNGELTHEQTLMLNELKQTFVFENVITKPKVSLLRNFSAPVNLHYDYTDDDLAFLLQHETNGFNQWQATQTLIERVLLNGDSPETLINALRNTLPTLSQTDPLLATRLLDVPSENQLASNYSKNYNPQKVYETRKQLVNAIANGLADTWASAYKQYPLTAYVDNSLEMGKRAWRNVALTHAFIAGANNAELFDQAVAWAHNQYDQASCMTERFGALQVLVNNADAIVKVQGALVSEKLADFHERFTSDELVIDMWFSVQAGNPTASIENITDLTKHARFDYTVPNRVRSVASQVARQPTKLWTVEGIAYFVELTKILDKKNPTLGARLVQEMANWYTLEAQLKQLAHNALVELQQTVTSSNVTETVNTMLKAG